MIKEDELIDIGKFLKPHALKGELNAYVEYDNDLLNQGYPVIVAMDGIYVPFFIEKFRPKGNFGTLIKLDGVNSDFQARKFVNKEIMMLKKDVAEFLDIDVNELIVEMDLVGYKVIDEKFGEIGRVVDIDDSTENVLLLVSQENDPDNIVYIPDNDDFIISVTTGETPEDSSIEVKLPEELLHLNRNKNSQD